MTTRYCIHLAWRRRPRGSRCSAQALVGRAVMILADCPVKSHDWLLVKCVTSKAAGARVCCVGGGGLARPRIASPLLLTDWLFPSSHHTSHYRFILWLPPTNHHLQAGVGGGGRRRVEVTGCYNTSTRLG